MPYNERQIKREIKALRKLALRNDAQENLAFSVTCKKIATKRKNMLQYLKTSSYSKTQQRNTN
jgi:hypothetical protein